MYNPNSVYRAMVTKKLNSYWKNTSAFDTINNYITLNFSGLKEDILTMLAGGSVPVNVNTFKNDLSVIGSKDEALTALIHLGYLGYNAVMEEAYIPNYEVSLAYQAALSTGQWSEIAASISRCQELLNATIRKDSDKVAELVELAHSSYTSLLKYNDENALSCVISLAYYSAQKNYTLHREMPAGKGFADIVFEPNRNCDLPALIVELKWGHSAEEAVEQIKQKDYLDCLKNYSGEVLLVGVNYDKEKRHTCRIERVKI